MKDNFSNNPAEYLRFRPDYPQAMIDFITSHVPNKTLALDVATGNGQFAFALADYFEMVYATDMSEAQLSHSRPRSNITYQVGTAEQLNFDDALFDLVTVAQAIHWFDFEKFYSEVHRVLKPGGIFAAIGYGLFSTNKASDEIIAHYYREIIGSYWDPERKYLDENYATIPFPFDEIPSEKFSHTLHWTFDELIGYLESWSATQHYINKNDRNPLDQIRAELKESWKQSNQSVTFPMLLRIGRQIEK